MSLTEAPGGARAKLAGVRARPVVVVSSEMSLPGKFFELHTPLIERFGVWELPFPFGVEVEAIMTVVFWFTHSSLEESGVAWGLGEREFTGVLLLALPFDRLLDSVEEVEESLVLPDRVFRRES